MTEDRVLGKQCRPSMGSLAPTENPQNQKRKKDSKRPRGPGFKRPQGGRTTCAKNKTCSSSSTGCRPCGRASARSPRLLPGAERCLPCAEVRSGCKANRPAGEQSCESDMQHRPSHRFFGTVGRAVENSNCGDGWFPWTTPLELVTGC